MEINHGLQPGAKLGFKGYQHKKSNEGIPLLDFNYLYDSKHWDCAVEFFPVIRNEKDYSYYIDPKCKNDKGELTPVFTKKLTPNGASVDPKNDLKLKASEPVAYRYKLTNKDNKEWFKYAKDDDESVCGYGCNLITRKSTTPIVQGPMYLGLPDSLNPGYVYAGFKEENTGEIIKDSKAKDLSNFNRTFANKAGGTLAGVQNKIPELKQKGYKRFIGTPTTGGDNRSAHIYWIKKMFQPASTLGNIDNYNSFQKELFKNGMGYVADSAYTSQGLEGVNFQYAVRWMDQEDKPHEYYMFRMQGLQDAALGMGLVPKNMENLRHKVVNSPHNYEVKPDGQVKITDNKEYNPKQPTFIQIYDDSMVSDEQRKDSKNLIVKYDNTNAMVKDKKGNLVQNNLAINNHDDTIMDNAFVINPAEYDANIKNLNTINKNRNISDKIDLNSPMGTLVVSKFSGIEIRPKDEGGFVTWDSNTDIAKLSYTESDYDSQMLESIKNPKERAIEEKKIARAHAANRDMLTDTMRYWTKHVRNVHTEYTAKTLGKLDNSADKTLDRINSLIYNRDNQKLPDDVAINKEIAENIIDNDYKLRDKDVDYEAAVNKALMATPLDSIELADDTVGALSSPYLSKRSPDLDHIGESRYDAMHDPTYVVPEKYAKTYNKMNSVFTNQIHEFATKVLQEADRNSEEKIFQNDSSKLTEYGQYIVPLVAGDIAKYAVIKSLVPNAETKILKDGTLTYDYEKLEKEATLTSIGINGDSPEDEANQIVNKIKNGTSELTSGDVSKLARAINTRFKDTNALSFRFAEAMVDRSGLGLDHRLDAAKDVADMDAVRSQQDRADNQFAEVINIWEKPIAAVKDENPNSLVLFEFTDVWDMMRKTYSTEFINKEENNMDMQKSYNDAKFKRIKDIIPIVIRETGGNTEANYSDTFTAGLNTFGKDFVGQDGIDPDNICLNATEEQRVALLSNLLDSFADKSIDYKRNAYTFGGNHDKPRMTECFGLDMALFHSNLNNHTTEKEIQHRKTAYMIMNDIMTEDKIPDEGWKAIKHDYGDKSKETPDYFNNVSPMAIAKGNWLRSSIGLANRVLTQERIKEAKGDKEAEARIYEDSNKIYAALSKSVKDLVNGDFYLNGENNNKEKTVADTYKKQLEKDGFGSKDILTGFDLLTQQAKEKYDLDDTYLSNKDFAKHFKQVFEKIAIGVPAAKARMYTQMLNAIPGNPTVYAGDDFAMTGYEEKNHNLYLQNRNVIPWDTVEKGSPNYKEYIAKHKEAIDGIVGTRKNDIDNKLKPLNNGTMYKLETLTGVSADVNKPGNNLKCPVIMAQDSNGSMALSVFNFNGISLENPIHTGIDDISKLDEFLNPKPTPVKLDRINLHGQKMNTNLDIPKGLKFKNIDSSDPSYYETDRDNKGNCFIQRVFEENGKKRYEPVYISKDTAPEGVLRLYYQPENVVKANEEKHALEKKYTPSFKGVRRYYNPQYNIAVTNPYSQPKQVQTGAGLSLVSK